MVAQVGALAHVFTLVANRLDSGQAARRGSVIAVPSMLGRFAGGVVLLRLDTRLLAVGLMALQGVALLVLGSGTGSRCCCRPPRSSAPPSATS